MDSGPTQTSYTFRAKATPEEALSAIRLARPDQRWVLFAVSIACLATAAVLMLHWDPVELPVGFAWFAIGAGLMFSLALPNRPDSRSRRIWNETLRDAVYTFDTNGIATASEDVTRYVRWHGVTEVRENRQVMVFMRGRTQVAFIPAAVLGSARDREAFVGFARSQVEAAARTTSTPQAAV